MPTIELDRPTYDAIDLAARVTGMTHSQVVARLVKQARTAPAPAHPGGAPGERMVDIHVDYQGHRTSARFDLVTHRVDVVDGPLAGQTFTTPSSAARAVITHFKPGVSPVRNGWLFWLLSDGSGRFLQALREE